MDAKKKSHYTEDGQPLLTREQWALQGNASHLVPGKIQMVDEQYTPDVTVELLYQPHTVTATIFAVAFLMWGVFTHNKVESHDQLLNLHAGLQAGAVFIVGLGCLVFPNGPFIRPHPLVWRIGFGVGVVYQLFLIVVLFQDKAGARALFKQLDPELGVPLVEFEYAENCTLTWENFSELLFDVYFLSHYLGWVVKSMMIRDTMMCWIISITWELIEICCTHLLPNFAECWWDQWLLDVALSNALGILTGTMICQWLEVKTYDWKGFFSIPTFKGKVQRAMMQFTPQSWTKVRWGKTKTIKRFLAYHGVIMFIHVEELNHFFLKHLLWVPPKSSLNVFRLFVMTFVGLPSVRQLYNYVTNPLCKRLGTQAFMTIVTFSTEIMICVKFSEGEFPNPMPEPLKTYTLFGAGLYVVLCVIAMGSIFYFNKTPLSAPSSPKLKGLKGKVLKVL